MIKMISLTTFKEYLGHKENYTYVNDEPTEKARVNNLLNRLWADLEDIIFLNMRKVEVTNNRGEIVDLLYTNTLDLISDQLDTLLSKNLIGGLQYSHIKVNLTAKLDYKIEVLALKIQKYVRLYKDESIDDIISKLRPSTMYNYLMRDSYLETIACDKIEIIDGRYYPVIYSNLIPDHLVSEDEQVVLTFLAMLIEQEFDTEVFVGFVEYTATSERKQVVIDSKHRKDLFKELHHLKELKEGKIEQFAEEGV
jgi:CRISPR-associated exonuclease Cas4